MSPYDGDIRDSYPAIIGPKPKASMREIGESVAARYGMTFADLKKETTRRSITGPRQEAMALCYATGQFSGKQVARFFGLNDHATVFHARKVYAQRLAEGMAAE